MSVKALPYLVFIEPELFIYRRWLPGVKPLVYKWFYPVPEFHGQHMILKYNPFIVSDTFNHFLPTMGSYCGFLVANFFTSLYKRTALFFREKVVNKIDVFV